MSDYILYILMRTDLDSMNPGKAMAQAAHAQADFESNNLIPLHLIKWWKEDRNFGITIVLAVDSEEELNYIVTNNKISGIVHDSTYPVRDGKVTHLIPVNTCGWVFTNDKDKLKNLKLHS